MCYVATPCGDCPECQQEEADRMAEIRDRHEWDKVCERAKEFEAITPASEREWREYRERNTNKETLTCLSGK